MTGIMEFLAFCVAPINLAYTILLGLVVFYWLTVAFGFLDIDFLDLECLDFDLDLDGDADVDMDADADVSVDGAAGSALQSALSFFHIGVVPVTIVISFMVLVLWATAMITHFALSVTTDVMMAICFVPILLVSLFLTRLAISPLVPILKPMKVRSGIAYESLVGKTCTVTTSRVDGGFGEAEIETGGSPIVVSVRTRDGGLAKGDEAVIIDEIEDSGIYRIKRL